MLGSFDNLSTEQFRKKMRPYAIQIYKMIWPGCVVNDLREDGCEVHILDKEFGIDTITTFESGQWISIQEKYREYQFLRYGDFTQEYMNRVGTPHEAPGEWFNLGAQVYFYGWADEKQAGFEKWFLMDITQYKLIMEKKGGIEKVGKLQHNKKHGSASFYGIPLKIIMPAFITDYREYGEKINSTAPLA